MGYYDNSGAATPWEDVDSNKLGADTRFKLLPQLLATKGYVSHAIGSARVRDIMRARARQRVAGVWLTTR